MSTSESIAIPVPSSTERSPELSPEVTARDVTFRKIIWRLIPFLTLIWFLAWVDRVNVGFAKLTMMSDLQWSDAIYGAGAGIFFLGYFFFEVPSNLVLQKFGARKTIMRITIGWGVMCVLMAWVTQPWEFYTLRFLMGAFEAGLQPGVILYLTYWLPTHRRGKALAFFVSASAISLMVGSPLAAYVMEIFNGTGGFKGWQWLFVAEGIPSVLVGIVAYFYLTDKPEQSDWLTAHEKAQVALELDAEQKALGPREHKVWASLANPKMLAMILVFFCIVAGNATLVYYGPSVVKEAGYTDIRTLGWVMSGIYACGWLGMILNGYLSDRYKEIRYHTAVAAAIGASGLLMAAYFLAEKNGAGVIFSLALSAAGTMGAIPVFWQIPGYFLSGTAIVVGLALINSIANLAGYFAPQLLGYLKSTTGRYSEGMLLVAMVEFVATITLLLAITIKKENSQERT